MISGSSPSTNAKPSPTSDRKMWRTLPKLQTANSRYSKSTVTDAWELVAADCWTDTLTFQNTRGLVLQIRDVNTPYEFPCLRSEVQSVNPARVPKLDYDPKNSLNKVPVRSATTGKQGQLRKVRGGANKIGNWSTEASASPAKLWRRAGRHE